MTVMYPKKRKKRKSLLQKFLDHFEVDRATRKKLEFLLSIWRTFFSFMAAVVATATFVMVYLKK